MKIIQAWASDKFDGNWNVGKTWKLKVKDYEASDNEKQKE